MFPDCLLLLSVVLGRLSNPRFLTIMNVVHLFLPPQLSLSTLVNAGFLNPSIPLLIHVPITVWLTMPSTGVQLQRKKKPPSSSRINLNQSSSKQNCVGVGKKKDPVDTGIHSLTQLMPRNKCQFAHSPVELRAVPRHPKYKTQLCKTFLEVPPAALLN
jgi:hypothetical protein